MIDSSEIKHIVLLLSVAILVLNVFTKVDSMIAVVSSIVAISLILMILFQNYKNKKKD